MVLGVCLLLSLPAEVSAQCGYERWSVKTGTDADVSQVDLSATATATTVAVMAALSKPAPLPASGRIQPTETTVWVVTATLTDFKKESDSGYHLVLRDSGGHTMIAEIPSPACVGTGSPFASQIANARAAFDAKYQVSSSHWGNPNIPVRVTGVGFFDVHHGTPQRGVAPNDIEIHPVLDIVFNPSGPSPTPSPSASPVAPNQLLVDSGFEEASSAWTATQYVIDSSTSPPARSGTHKAWLGGNDAHRHPVADGDHPRERYARCPFVLAARADRRNSTEPL